MASDWASSKPELTHSDSGWPDQLFGPAAVVGDEGGVRLHLEIEELGGKRKACAPLLVVFWFHTPVEKELPVIEAVEVPDPHCGQLLLGHGLAQVLAESRHAVATETSREPGDRPRGAPVVVDVQAVRLRLRHFRQSHLEILPVKRAIGTPPPGRLALVLVVPQPRHHERLALEVAAGGIEEVRAEVDHTAGLGQKADAGGKEPHPVGMGILDMLCPGPACPAENGATVRLVFLGIIVHEDHVGVAERERGRGVAVGGSGEPAHRQENKRNEHPQKHAISHCSSPRRHGFQRANDPMRQRNTQGPRAPGHHSLGALRVAGCLAERVLVSVVARPTRKWARLAQNFGGSHFFCPQGSSWHDVTLTVVASSLPKRPSCMPA